MNKSHQYVKVLTKEYILTHPKWIHQYRDAIAEQEAEQFIEYMDQNNG